MLVSLPIFWTLYIIYWALKIYFYIIIASILLSWLPEIKRSTIGRFITRLTDPFLNFFRGLLVVGMFDFTPIIGILLYQFGLSYFYQMIYIMSQQIG